MLIKKSKTYCRILWYHSNFFFSIPNDFFAPSNGISCLHIFRSAGWCVCKRPVVTLNYQQLHSISSHPVAIAVFASSLPASSSLRGYSIPFLKKAYIWYLFVQFYGSKLLIGLKFCLIIGKLILSMTICETLYLDIDATGVINPKKEL